MASRAGGLLLLVIAAIVPDAAAFGFSSAPTVGAQCRRGLVGANACSVRPLRAMQLRMGREDGGAGKISKPGGGSGVGNKPGQGAGDGGAGEGERGGAGVAVLTKPPDVDKVMHLLPACVLCSQPPGAPWVVPAGANHSRLRLTARYRPRSSDNCVALQANELDRKEAVDKEPIWRVLLHNDDVHTFDYVIDTIVSVVRTVTRKKAHRITMEAHKSGLATVTTTWKQLAREYSLGLQKAGLTSSIAPDKSNSC